MDPIVIALVAGSALLHVAWNVRLKSAGDPLIAATIGLLVGSLVIVPLALVVWWLSGRDPIDPTGVALGLASGVIEAVYFVLLAAAYRRGDLSVVYPIARGTAPLLLVVIGVVVLGERLAPAGWVGVACLLVGFLVLQRPWRALAPNRSGGRDAAVGFAFLTGVAIAGYTTIDRVGTRIITPVVYAAILWVTGAILLVGWIRLRHAGPLTAGGPEAVRYAAIGGILTLGAYMLVLIALSVAPLTAVAPLRESATVVAAAWGAVRLGEAEDRPDAARRVMASTVIVVGALLLALSG
ncbi:MAG: EamA family transporter [Chloroflexota bacterium]